MSDKIDRLKLMEIRAAREKRELDEHTLTVTRHNEELAKARQEARPNQIMSGEKCARVWPCTVYEAVDVEMHGYRYMDRDSNFTRPDYRSVCYKTSEGHHSDSTHPVFIGIKFVARWNRLARMINSLMEEARVYPGEKERCAR